MTALLQSLAKVSDLWLDPAHPLREETIQALQVSTGLGRRQIEMALANCFTELSASMLAAFHSTLTPTPKKSIQVLHVLPSNVFTAWVHGAVITLLLGHRCLLKPSRREPVFARAWQKSLAGIDAEIAGRVDIVSWDEKTLKNSQAVVAYGSDESLKKIRSQCPPGIAFAGYGHKLSVGIIFQEALREGLSADLLTQVCQDAEPFRLQGCLSPQILYLENERSDRWPSLEAALDVAPKIRRFSLWEDLLADLMKFNPYLSCVGYAGSPEKRVFLQSELRDSEVSRVCVLGEMQRPPLSWNNGGISLIDVLQSGDY